MIEAEESVYSAIDAELAQAQARKLKKATVKSYNVPVGDSRLNVNVKKELHDKLKSSASEKGITVGRLVEMLIIKYL